MINIIVTKTNYFVKQIYHISEDEIILSGGLQEDIFYQAQHDTVQLKEHVYTTDGTEFIGKTDNTKKPPVKVGLKQSLYLIELVRAL